jgi:hypothetical protein
VKPHQNQLCYIVGLVRVMRDPRGPPPDPRLQPQRQLIERGDTAVFRASNERAERAVFVGLGNG